MKKQATGLSICIRIIALLTVSWALGQSNPSSLFHIPYTSEGALDSPVLVMVLHGDAPFNNPSYQYRIAKTIAERNKNVVAVGILRPGYEDGEGHRSEGVRGEATGDNYTIEVLESVYHLTNELAGKYKPSKIILVGHSGGAAISANLVSQYSGTYSNAVLISCPCDLHTWRKHMKQLQSGAEIWDVEVNSLSPIEEVKTMDSVTKISLIHGDSDEIVPLSIAEKYDKELEKNSIQVSFEILENQGHAIALNKRVFEIIDALIN